MDSNEFFPSLIKYLDTGDQGFYLDLWLPGERSDKIDPITAVRGPFSKRISAQVKIAGGDAVAPVVLIMQRNRYPQSRFPASTNNRRIDQAWQNAWVYYNSGWPPIKPIMLKDQVSPTGELRAFAPLFTCRHTHQWFHPVCPQCGTALTLCRDDERLKTRGLPGYSDSLSRFLHCGSCSKLSETASFFSPQKEVGMPATAHDQKELILMWNQLLERFPEDADLPCRRCYERSDCYTAGGRANDRITAFAFFPFYCLILPAPSFGAAAFIRSIAGDSAAPVANPEKVSPLPASNRFLFQGEDRQFLEILYLKLTFLQQIFDQLGLVDPPGEIQEFDFSLDSIGVDLTPSGTGLPAFWSFRSRMLDSVGSFQSSPFTPSVPESMRLHFLGAVWFQTLLVNSQQSAEVVFEEVGSLLHSFDFSSDGDVTIESGSRFAGRQIHWFPEGKNVSQQWEGYWQNALQLGFQLVRAGTKISATWDGQNFRETIVHLREKIKSEMFSENLTATPVQYQPAQPARFNPILGRILEKWQAQADAASRASAPASPDSEDPGVPTPPAETIENTAAEISGADDQPLQPEPAASSGVAPEPDGWDGEIEETVVLSATEAIAPPGTAGMTTDPSPGEDDIQETVVLPGGAVGQPPNPRPPDKEEQTVVISASSQTPPDPPVPPDTDLEVTMVQSGAAPAPEESDWQDADQEATVVIRGGTQPPPGGASPSSDDDLEATVIQSAERGPRETPPAAGGAGSPSAADPASDQDLEATVVLNAAKQTPSPTPPLTDNGDEDLAATLIESPRSSDHPPLRKPPVSPGPSQSRHGEAMPDRPAPTENEGADAGGEDDDIMEQTVIIRSELKKE